MILVQSAFCLVLSFMTILLLLRCQAESSPNQQELVIHRSFSPIHDGVAQSRAKRSASTRYSLFIDAGSSASRIWIYTWTSSRSVSLPEVSSVGRLNVSPGLSSQADNTSDIQNTVIKLINYAKLQINETYHKETPIYLFATAGLRLLPEDMALRVTEVVYQVFNDKTICPFVVYDRQSVRILSGEEEGVFMWLAVNYLSGTFEKDDTAQTIIGTLELGGASTQIAFIPSGLLLANKFPVDIARRRYSLYVHSYLGFGQDELKRWVQDFLIGKQPQPTSINNPCMLKGDSVVYNARRFVGSGNSTQCTTILHEKIYRENSSRCSPSPCGIGSIYQPPIPVDTKFYALGAFYYSLNDIYDVKSDPVVRFPQVRSIAEDFCSKNLSELKIIYPAVQEKYMSSNCLTAIYIDVLLKIGYGFSDSSTKIMVKNEIKGVTIDWTLGALLYERFTHPTYKDSASQISSSLLTRVVLNIVLNIMLVLFVQLLYNDAFQ